MSVNFKKSCCLTVGQRFNVTCANIISLNGQKLPWVSEMKYLGIHVVSSKLFRCSIHEAKRSFYRSANEIFGKIGRFAPENVTLHAANPQRKCIPALLYGLEACPLNKADLNSLDFVVNRFFMKLFRTGNINIVRECQIMFQFQLPVNYLKNGRKIHT